MENRKKILIFSLMYYPHEIGGAEVAIKEFTDRLGDFYDFDMVTLRLDSDIPKKEKIGNINVYRVGFCSKRDEKGFYSSTALFLNKYMMPFTAFLKALKLNKNKKYDLVWSMMATYSGFSTLFFKLFYPKIPFVLSLQEGDPIEYIKKKVGIFLPVFKKIFQKADCIQAISNYLISYAKEMGYKRNVILIPNGVDCKKFSEDVLSEDVFSVKKELEKKDNDIFLVTTSRLVVKNGVKDIIKSLKYLPADFKLLIIGDGYLKDSLRELVSDLSLQHKVRFFGFVDQAEIPKYLKASDIFVRPALSEGFGNSFIEAMASGIPVVATPVGGIVDFLENGENGLFCEVENPKSLAEKVLLLEKDKILKKKIVENASKMVKEKYDWDILSKKMKDEVFDKLL